MSWAQNLQISVYIELIAGTLNIVNIGVLMLEYCCTNKAYVQ